MSEDNGGVGEVRLDERDRALLAGEEGEAARLAMRILTRMAAVRGAASMLDIEAAHIDSTIYVGDAGLEFAERLAGLGARVRVPSTLNVSGLDEFHWREWAVPPEWAEKSARQMRAYASMGTTPTWTCAPYQAGHAPRFGQQIAWGESNAVCFANSVIGARTERYPDLLDICCAVTGRAPAVGLHLDENRLAAGVLRLEGIPERLAAADDFYPVLGHLLGAWAEDEPAAITGLPGRPRRRPAQGARRRRRLFGGGGAVPHPRGHSRGAHPAGTRSAAGRRSAPAPWHRGASGLPPGAHQRRGWPARPGDARQPPLLLHRVREAGGDPARARSPGAGEPATSSLPRAAPSVISRTGPATSNRCAPSAAWITVDTCILATPMLPGKTRRLMTNSAKYAWYAPGAPRDGGGVREPRRVRGIGAAGAGSSARGDPGTDGVREGPPGSSSAGR